MATGPALTQDQNILPVQALFDLQNNFVTFIGQGQPFTVPISGVINNATITNSTINSTTIGATTPSTGVFTNVTTTTGTISTTPVGSTDIANKLYVDTVALGVSWKEPAQAATTANITLSGLQTIDGVTLVAGNIVLVKNQTNAAQNGIYVASSGAWSYAPGSTTWAQYVGAIIFVDGGAQAGSLWYNLAQPGGTLGTTAMTWSNFSLSGVYTAGTGLTLSGSTFSITNTAVTAGSYGSASSVPTYIVNAQGQLTAASNTAIAINGNQITSGTVGSSYITGSYTGITGVGTLTAGTWNGNTITVPYGGTGVTSLTGIAYGNGTSAFTAATGSQIATAIGSTYVTNATNATSVSNSLTINNSGSGAVSGSTYNGFTALTVSYNTVGAPSTTGTNASGTWGINITGNAATATSATSATTATNIAGGANGSVPYQISSGNTGLLPAGTSGQLLVTLGSYAAPAWTSIVSLSSVTTSTLITSGLTGYLYGNGSSAVTASTTIPTSALSGQVALANGGTNASLTAVAGGAVYSTGSALAITAAGTSGQILTSNGTGVPSWQNAPATGITIIDDTTTNATRYLTLTSATSGTITGEYTSSTKLQFNPSTGALTTTSLTPTNALAAGYGGTGLTSPGTSGNVLTSNGTSWVSSAPTGSVGPIVYNTKTVSSNITFTSGQNGFSVGPISVGSGISVTVGSGQRWVVI